MKLIMNRWLPFLAAILLLAVGVFAQNGPPIGNDGPQPPRNPRRALFRQLGLSKAQMREVAQLNAGRRVVMENAQQRFRAATRRLDEAIYSDQLNEGEVQSRLKEVQDSQAELIRLRSMNELSIRKILTPEQLVRFRRMRQRFDAARREDRRADADADAAPRNSGRDL